MLEDVANVVETNNTGIQDTCIQRLQLFGQCPYKRV